MMADGHYYTRQIKDASSTERYPRLFSRDIARTASAAGFSSFNRIPIVKQCFLWGNVCYKNVFFFQMFLKEAVNLQLKRLFFLRCSRTS